MKPVRSQSRRSKGGAADDLRNLEEYRDISDDVIESDFVPYACLFDTNSIATKDGEVLQTIKITGLGFEAKAQDNLRNAIRKAMRQAIPDERYGIWLHTLRRHRNLMTHSHFPDKFSGQVDEAWRSQHPSSVTFVNELYITIVRAGEPTSLKTPGVLARSLSSKMDRFARTTAMERANAELNDVVEHLIDILGAFEAKRLTLVERDGVFYSEQLEFLEKLINLEERAMPVPLRDLSQVLTSGEISFGHNAMEVRTADGQRRFATIFSLKEYKESTLAGIDMFLDIPCELIITQCFDFVGGDAAREIYEKQARYLNISGDKELRGWMEIDRLTQGGNASRLFGQQQTSVFLISPTMAQLEANVKNVLKALSRLGMVAVREDLLFEDCYWAQLPGNFNFIRRKKPIDTEHLAGFANLQTVPMGNPQGSAWGPPVSLLTTVQDKPYFFNLQRDNLLHTLVLGNKGTGRTTLTHFLVTQARKLDTRLWYLDAEGRVDQFFSAMGASAVVPGSASCRLNPFALPDTPGNREFLALFLSTLVDPTGTQLTRASLEFFQSVVAAAMQLPVQQRRLSTILPVLRNADPALAVAVARYCEGGEFGGLFDAEQDTCNLAHITGWNLADFMQNDATRVPLTSYLLHRITLAVADNKPTILVMTEGFSLLDTPLFGPRAAGWVDYLAQHQVAILFSIGQVEPSSQYNFANAVSTRAANVFAMADPHAGVEYAMGYALSETDITTLSYLDRHRHHVLLKRGAEAHVMKLDVSAVGAELLSGLSARKKTDATKPERSAADLLAELMGFDGKADA